MSDHDRLRFDIFTQLLTTTASPSLALFWLDSAYDAVTGQRYKTECDPQYGYDEAKKSYYTTWLESRASLKPITPEEAFKAGQEAK
jgi:hypothetical protein